ncbi:MAG: hypothetical protein H0X47_03050 [Nitrospirales bacterium]|nr:hypothetical protein [Nitrospirales bacterium]
MTRYLFRRALGDDVAAGIATARSQINHPIRTFDNVQVMFDHQDRITFLHQLIQDG